MEAINPPVFATPPAQPQRLPLDPALIAQFRANCLAKSIANPRRFLAFSATVYDHMYTRLLWRHGEEEYVAWSNIDFTVLSGLPSVRQGNTTFEYFFCAGTQSTRPVVRPDGTIRPAPKHPDIPALPATPAFVVTEGDDTNSDALACVQALHDIYLKELPAITKFRQDRAQYRAGYEAWLKTHPPGPENVTIRYWVDGQSTPSTPAADESGKEVAP